jgi:ATP-dependent DNA helicase DinG
MGCPEKNDKFDDGLEAIFGGEGALTRAVEGFWPRPQQSRMALAVDETFDTGGRLVVEAGTGTGKTFAYLVPALLSGKKVIISTGTKNLQDQLFNRDLPTVRKALGAPVKLALLKGRQNYLCLQRMEVAAQDSALEDSAREILAAARGWAGRTDAGDVGELGPLPDSAGIRGRITSTAENCLGSKCPVFSDCFVVKARRRAQQADVVIVNHHLLLADMALRKEGFGELLPGADAVVLDEAHQLPGTASTFFGFRISARQLRQLVQDTRAENEPFQGETEELDAALDALQSATQALEKAAGRQPYRQPWEKWAQEPYHAAALNALAEGLARLAELLEALAERSRGLEQCGKRTAHIQARLAMLTGEAEEDESAGEAHIRWVENFRQGFILHLTPLHMANTFRRTLDSHATAWVFTSATLSVNADFTHFTEQMGLADSARTLALDSPFDYQNNTLLYLPAGLPLPNDPAYTQAMLRGVLPLLDASGGGAFLLFTSYRALNEAADWLADNAGFPLFVQGQADRNQLLDHFRDSGNGILLGTSSFWEGVDVRGPALRLVIIDRLPFTAPSDPVLQARLEALRAEGIDPFTGHQLPQAVMGLKQGAGRLIRDRNDRGVLVLCDPRVTKRGYGRLFLDSLPEMPVTNDEARVTAFLAALATGRPT